MFYIPTKYKEIWRTLLIFHSIHPIHPSVNTSSSFFKFSHKKASQLVVKIKGELLDRKSITSPICCNFEIFNHHPQLGFRRSWPKKKKLPKLAIRNPLGCWLIFWKKNLFFSDCKKKKTANNFSWLANLFRWLVVYSNFVGPWKKHIFFYFFSSSRKKKMPFFFVG